MIEQSVTVVNAFFSDLGKKFVVCAQELLCDGSAASF